MHFACILLAFNLKQHHGSNKNMSTDKDGNLHSYDDLPAKSYWGNREWYFHGKLHRDNDLPAFISARGDKEWYQHGKRHRDIGPAVVRRARVGSREVTVVRYCSEL